LFEGWVGTCVGVTTITIVGVGVNCVGGDELSGKRSGSEINIVGVGVEVGVEVNDGPNCIGVGVGVELNDGPNSTGVGVGNGVCIGVEEGGCVCSDNNMQPGCGVGVGALGDGECVSSGGIVVCVGVVGVGRYVGNGVGDSLKLRGFVFTRAGVGVGCVVLVSKLSSHIALALSKTTSISALVNNLFVLISNPFLSSYPVIRPASCNALTYGLKESSIEALSKNVVFPGTGVIPKALAVIVNNSPRLNALFGCILLLASGITIPAATSL